MKTLSLHRQIHQVRNQGNLFKELTSGKNMYISTIQELCKMRDGILYSGLNTQEIQVLIDSICTEDIMPIP